MAAGAIYVIILSSGTNISWTAAADCLKNKPRQSGYGHRDPTRRLWYACAVWRALLCFACVACCLRSCAPRSVFLSNGAGQALLATSWQPGQEPFFM